MTTARTTQSKPRNVRQAGEPRPAKAAPTVTIKPKAHNIADRAWEIGPDPKPADWVDNPFVLTAPPPRVLPKGKVRSGTVIGMDWSGDVQGIFAWAANGAFREGIGFMGYPYLAQLTQRPEYRRISEIIALEMTRKWIKVVAKGDAKSPKVAKMEEALVKFKVQELFRRAAELDGFFGRGQLFVDDGNWDDPEELKMPLVVDKRKIDIGQLRGFRIIEPLWSYPGQFNSDNPLHPTFYKPQQWFVNGVQVHASRLLTFVSRELPDILKPAYQFGGLSMSQMAKPYVDNWLRTRQSVSDLLHSFSTMVLATDLSTVLQDGGAATMLVRRAEIYNRTRDNRGLLMVNKDTEELTNVAAPLSGLDALQAQSQEQMASVAGIPLVVLLGITPSGLNASSDGEIRTFYAKIKADQEAFFRPNLTTVFNLLQLHVFGEIDDGITFEFNPLWEEDETEDATVAKTQADTDAVYIQAGVIDPEEVRERLAGTDGSPYHGLDLNKVIEAPIPPGLEGDPDDDEDPDAPPGQDPPADA